MGSLNPFKAPKPKPPPPVPQGPSDAELAAAAEDSKRARRDQRGRASTILSKGEDASKVGGVLGDDSSRGGLGTKKLLGG